MELFSIKIGESKKEIAKIEKKQLLVEYNITPFPA